MLQLYMYDVLHIITYYILYIIYRVYQNSRMWNAQRDCSYQNKQLFPLGKLRLSITF